MHNARALSGSSLICLLAAGRGERFGGGKLDAMLAGQPLGTWALRTAQQCGYPIALITGTVPPAFATTLPATVSLIPNPDSAQGMGTSIRLAARAAHSAGAARLLLMLADMPFLTTGTLHALLAATEGPTNGPTSARTSNQGASACLYPDGHHGPPACFSAGLFPLLEALPPDAGAQRVLHHAHPLHVITPAASELADIDTRADLARLSPLTPPTGC